MITNHQPQIAAPVANDIRDIKPPIDIPNGWAWLWRTLGMLAGAAVLFSLEMVGEAKGADRIRATRAGAHPRETKTTGSAYADFAAEAIVIAVSDTARFYLEERFQFRAPERTTEEFLRELGGTDILTDEQKESLGGFLESCDLVKFAKYEPREPELRELHASAVQLVEETEPKEISSSESQITNVEPLSPATKPEELVNRKL